MRRTGAARRPCLPVPRRWQKAVIGHGGSARIAPCRILPRILVFDSGLGGLTVLREIVAARPDAHYVYVADDAFFPYGHHSEEAIIARVVPLVGELIDAPFARSRRDRLQHRFHACDVASAQRL